MLMQSGSDAVHLLPALPDVWSRGTVSGLRAKGGFEIVDMRWENSKLVKVVILSNLGGNLRLRVPNVMTLINGNDLIKAIGENSNSFYQTENVPAPVISPAATISPLALKETVLYDLPTQQGRLYTLISQ
jgi:alpha-L-fucosidase 2